MLNRMRRSCPRRTISTWSSTLVRKAFELYATGHYTLDRLTKTINDLGLTSRPYRTNGPRKRGVTPLSRPQYHRLLSNPIYYGVIRYGGQLYEGQHKPVITKELFDRVQAVMGRKMKPRGRCLKPYLYRGFFHCGECGGAITVETQKGHNYLRCTKKLGPCSQPFVREEVMSAMIDATLKSVALPADWLDALRVELHREGQQIQEVREAHQADLDRKIVDVDAKLQRLTAAYVEEALSLNEFREAKNRLVEDKANLRAQLARLRDDHETWLEPLTRFINALFEASLQASNEDAAEKAEFLKKLGSNLTVREKTLHIEFKKPWKILEKHGRFAPIEPAAPLTGAAACGEINHVVSQAEEVRFELTGPLRAHRFSRPAHSATLPLLRSANRQ